MNMKDGSVSIIKEGFAPPAVLQISGDDSLAVAIARNYLLVKCAWCGLDMGFKPSNGLTSYSVSHGICPDCVPKMLM